MNASYQSFVDTVLQLLPAQRSAVELLATNHQEEPMKLLRELIDRGYFTKTRVCQMWADSLGVAYVNPFNVEIPTETGLQLPPDIARRATAIALNTLGETVTVAMAEPLNEKLVDSLRKALGKEISAVFSHPDEISAIIDVQLGSDDGQLGNNLQKLCDNWPALKGGREINSAEDVRDLISSKAVVELYNSIILTAFRRRASDIHFEARADECRIRMRIDGDMCDILDVPKAVHDTLVSRTKVLASLDVTQNRMPQDGAFEINLGMIKPAFRCSMLPSLYGEKAVIRVLGSPLDRSPLRLNSLGFSDSTLRALKRVITRPSGILIVCGPTGSGKTTTLYGCLNQIHRPDLNIVTIEDPVEYRLAGITQHQVNASIDLTFGRILRTILRQDPDVILVGEIRDLETARIATEAALTGHFVLTTLHTNSALQAVTRLIEIGVDPYLVAPTAMGVLSQRLVRRICSSCKEAYKPSFSELRPYFADAENAPVTLYRGAGCPKCFGTGYHGRVGIYEFIEITERMRDMIAHKVSADQLVIEARKVGFRSLRHDGLKKVILGWTTLEEVERNTLPEWVDDMADK